MEYEREIKQKMENKIRMMNNKAKNRKISTKLIVPEMADANGPSPILVIAEPNGTMIQPLS